MKKHLDLAPVVLRLLAANYDWKTSAEVAAATGFSQGSVSRALIELAEQGLVNRSLKNFAITRRGLAALEQQELEG